MPSERLILGFDTSAAHCAAALFRGDAIVEERTEEMVRGQAERLMPMLHEVLAEAGHEWRDLTALAVGIGPGNFTGIRIAVGAARGLAMALSVPAIGVSLLQAAAHGAPRPALACIDARRDRAYLQRFDANGSSEPALVALDAIPDGLRPPGIVCVGPFAGTVAAAIGAPTWDRSLSPADAICRIAAMRDAQAAERPAPLYIREADARPMREVAPALRP